MSSRPSLPAVGERIATRLELAAALTRCPVAAVFRFDDDKATLVGEFGFQGWVNAPAPQGRVISFEHGQARPVRLRSAPEPEAELLGAYPGKSAISIPIFRPDGTLVGAVVVADQVERRDFALLDHQVLSGIGRLMAEAVGETRKPRRPPSEVRRAETLPPWIADDAAWPIRLAQHDPVTGLPDGRMLADSLDHSLDAALNKRVRLAVGVLSLMEFQRIDDWLGKSTGDELLCQIAERILDHTEDHDLVGRGNHDEFIVSWTEVQQAMNPEAMADRLLQALREPFHVRGYELSVNPCIGLANFPRDADDAASLIRYASIALHDAKGRGRRRLAVFRPELKTAIDRRAELERGLRRALAHRELSLVYQPKIRLKDNSLVGLEALLRWQSAPGVIQSPGAFLPIAEESGLIVPIGSWVLLSACEQIRQWLDAGFDPGRVSVNVAAAQFGRADFIGTVERALRSHDIEPARLELEITETSLMDDVESAARRLEALRKLGVGVSVDDFGTGYSSLAYLQRFPLDVVKIDRSFIRDLDREGDEGMQARSLARTITQLGHSLNLRVLAEGVETQGQLRALREMGVDEVQGYLLARPTAPAQLPEAARGSQLNARPPLRRSEPGLAT